MEGILTILFIWNAADFLQCRHIHNWWFWRSELISRKLYFKTSDDVFLLAKFIFRRQLYCRPMRHFCYCCRRDKLWICMEYCGGGSLQDIYHSEFVISIDRYSHHCSLLASDWLSICTIKWWLNLQICFIREQIETATGTFQGKLFTYTQYTVWCYRMLR